MDRLHKTIYVLSCVIVCMSESGFILTAPKVLDAGSTEFLTFSLFNVPDGGSVTIKLLKPYSDVVISETTLFSQNNYNAWAQLEVPDVRDSVARLQIIDNFNLHDKYHINATKEIRIRHKSVIMFIQTDKPIYKAGQTVKFRILPMDNQLLPLKGKTTGDVWIEDSTGIRIEQWKKVDFSNGIIQLELPLSEEPVLGTWTIHARIKEITSSQAFRIGQYVLPKYEVNIIPPPYIMADAQEIPIKICAQYTYGKKVEGHAKVIVTYLPHSYEEKYIRLPFVELEGPISGCLEYVVNAKDIQLQYRQFGERMIKIIAEVVENSTGIKQNSTSAVEISHSPLEITFMGADKDSHYFKPGLPYYGELQLSKPDGSAATSEHITVCAKPKRKTWESNIELCNAFTSDKQGKVHFIVPPQTATVHSIFVEAKSLYEEKRYASYGVMIYPSYSNIFLKPWHSPSNSHLQIEPITREVECDRLERVKIHYTTHDGSTIKFYHQVISRGRIVQQGSHHRTFAARDELPLDMEDPRVLRNTRQSPQYGTFPLDDEPFVADKSPANKTMVGHFRLSFDARATMSPVARILVFYVKEDGEVVADTRAFHIAHCLQNQVKLHFRHPQQYPSTEAALLVSASANSICGIGLVDKSVHLLSQENKFEKQTVFDLVETFDVGKDTLPKQISKDFCQRYIDSGGLRHSNNFVNSGLRSPPDGILRRRKRLIMLDVRTRLEFADSMTAFEEAGMVVITDFTLENRPCIDLYLQNEFDTQQYPYGTRFDRITVDSLRTSVGIPPGAITAPEGLPVPLSQKTNPKPDVEIRSHFPETWLWELHNIGSSGEMALKRELPHTITEWVGKAVCMHPKTGLGISDDSSITAFQPFFVSLSLPYSIVRGEVLSMVVTVFNYLTECLPIKLSLEASETFTIMDESPSHKLCVCGEKSGSWPFRIRPVVLGNINITVYAYSLQEDIVCENEITARLSARDAVTRSLLVEADGFPKEETINVYFCPEKSNGSYTNEFDLLLPDDTVDNSARGFMSVTGDLMGPALSGLESLVTLPVGCGEQNMARFTPNIYVLDYLTATNRLTDEIRHKAIGYLKIGYQRELKYRHEDGSYSAFGKSDNEGSMWLTAFVVKSFAQARRFLPLDEGDLAVSVAWIVREQLENGCFASIGKLLNKALKGGSKDDGTSLAPLTAFVLISLLESNYRANQTVNSAVFCLKSEKFPNTYSLALFAYATALAKSPDAEGYLHFLEKRAIKSGHFQYWDNGGKDRAINIEIAGYVVLSMLEIGGANSLARTFPIVRWIIQQRNSNGGFVSTQDTVVALQALAKYGSYSHGEKVNIDLTIESDELVQRFKVHEGNKLVTQSIKIPLIPAVVDFQATGEGCALAQFFMKYNVETIQEIETFHLKAVTERSMRLGCNILVIDVCMRYNVPHQVTNMIIIEAKMISGYVPDEFELHMLHNDRDLKLKRHDVKENKIIFYFSQLTNDKRCFKFYLKNEINVENPKDATVKIYDYYQPEINAVTTYHAPVHCSPISRDNTTKRPLLTANWFESISSSSNMLDDNVTLDHTTNDYSEVTESYSTDHDLLTTAYTETYKAAEVSTTSNGNSSADHDAHTAPLTIVTTRKIVTSTSTEATMDEGAPMDKGLTNDVELSDEPNHPRISENLINVDEDLNFPDGMEANQAVFALPPQNETFPDIIASCPMCFENFPENFSNIYCAASFVLRVAVRNVESGGIKVLNDVSAHLTKPKAIKEYGRLIYKAGCECPNLEQLGNVFIIGVDDSLWQQSGGMHHIILNSGVRIITAPNKVVRPPELKRAWKECN